MFEQKSFFEILSLGGGTMYILLLASVISISVIIMKILEFRRKSRLDIRDFIRKIQTKLQKDSIAGVINLCESTDTPVSNVIKAGILRFRDTHSSDVKDSMNREILLKR